MLARGIVGVSKPVESTGELVMLLPSSAEDSVCVLSVGTSPRLDIRCRARVTALFDRLWPLCYA